MRNIVGALVTLILWSPLSLAEAPSHPEEIRAWQQERLAALKHANSYLTIVGLHWLRPGISRFGGAASVDIRLPGDMPDLLGEFEFDGEQVVMRVTDRQTVLVDGALVTDAVQMHDDVSDHPVTASFANLSWGVIERGGRHAVRVRDTQHPLIEGFGPLPYYSIDVDYRVQARLRRYPVPKIVQVGTVIEGLGWEPESPGVVEFVLNGETYQLEAYAAANDRLFFVFGDRTNGRDTYPAGRFLYADDPGEGTLTVLDFNKSYSPPCAFNDFSTCPVATPANRLPVAVPVGERYDKALGPMAVD